MMELMPLVVMTKVALADNLEGKIILADLEVDPVAWVAWVALIHRTEVL